MYVNWDGFYDVEEYNNGPHSTGIKEYILGIGKAIADMFHTAYAMKHNSCVWRRVIKCFRTSGIDLLYIKVYNLNQYFVC